MRPVPCWALNVQVPHFFFDTVVAGATEPDDQGIDCLDAATAREEAVHAVTAMLKDRPLPDRPVTMIVREQTGRPLFRVAASVRVEPLGQSDGSFSPDISARGISA
jgi:hypothetical protein